MRQFLDETDGIRQETFLPVRQREMTRQRVECREELVFGKGLGASQAVQQRRFSGIRVANERDERQRGAFAAALVQGREVAR